MGKERVMSNIDDICEDLYEGNSIDEFDQSKIKQALKLLELTEERYNYLNDFEGIRKEWHNRTVEELQKLLENSKTVEGDGKHE